MARRVIAAVTDLFFIAKMQAAARHAGVELGFVSTTEELLAKAEAGVDLVVLDLNDPNLDILGEIETLRANPETASLPLLGFISHVDVDLAEQAKKAGCDRVVPRSQFSSRLIEMLGG